MLKIFLSIYMVCWHGSEARHIRFLEASTAFENLKFLVSIIWTGIISSVYKFYLSDSFMVHLSVGVRCIFLCCWGLG